MDEIKICDEKGLNKIIIRRDKYYKLVEGTNSFILDANLTLSVSIFQAKKSISFEIADILILAKDLTKMLDKDLRRCYFNPPTDASITIEFIKTETGRIQVKSKLFDELYEGKLETVFFIERYQLSDIIEEINSFLFYFDTL